MKPIGRIYTMLLMVIVAQLVAGCAGVTEHPPAFVDTALGQRCLKEGEPCSTLNDECCPGYKCYIGLAPTCVRNPADD